MVRWVPGWWGYIEDDYWSQNKNQQAVRVDGSCVVLAELVWGDESYCGGWLSTQAVWMLLNLSVSLSCYMAVRAMALQATTWMCCGQIKLRCICCEFESCFVCVYTPACSVMKIWIGVWELIQLPHSCGMLSSVDWGLQSSLCDVLILSTCKVYLFCCRFSFCRSWNSSITIWWLSWISMTVLILLCVSITWQFTTLHWSKTTQSHAMK